MVFQVSSRLAPGSCQRICHFDAVAGGSAVGYRVPGDYCGDRITIVLEGSGGSGCGIRGLVIVLSRKFHLADVARTLRVFVGARVSMAIPRCCHAAHVALCRYVRVPFDGLSGSPVHRIRAGLGHDDRCVLGNPQGPTIMVSVAWHWHSIRHARARRNSCWQLSLHGKMARIALCSGGWSERTPRAFSESCLHFERCRRTWSGDVRAEADLSLSILVPAGYLCSI